MMRPFKDGMLNQGSMADIFGALTSQLEELKSYKEQAADFDLAPA